MDRMMSPYLQDGSSDMDLPGESPRALTGAAAGRVTLSLHYLVLSC